MRNISKQSNAVKILHKKFIAGSSEREDTFDKERVNAKIARLIFDYREDAGLTQKQLAGLIGTTQSVISRLEDADYEGHSLTMLNKIAQALNRELSIDMTDGDVISVRLQKTLIRDLKELAAGEGLDYQPYLRQILTKHVRNQKRKA